MQGEGTSGVSERVLSTLLNEMDGISKSHDVLIVGCTNRPDMMDSALLRPGRIDQRMFLGFPSRQDRHEIIKVAKKKAEFSSDVDMEFLLNSTECFSGADLRFLIRYFMS